MTGAPAVTVKRSGAMHADPTALRRVCLAAALLMSTLAVSCSVLDSTRSLTLSEADLQRRVEMAFPIDRRLLDVLDVMVSAPRLRLIPDRNRVATELNISTRDRLFGGRWQGRIALESALRYEASDQSLRLSQVRVQQFSVDGVTGSGVGGSGSGGGSMARAQAERLGSVLVERVLEGFSLYRLPPGKAATLQRAGVMPGEVVINARGVEITLVPIRR